MQNKIFNVLFLCTGNSARSIMGECILDREGKSRFNSYSAGSQPKGEILPAVHAFLERAGYNTNELRSKSWHEFAVADAPEIDFIFTVCDNAAGEVCPVWPGYPLTVHWGVPDPAIFKGSEHECQKHVTSIYSMLLTRIRTFIDLPIQSMDVQTLKEHLVAIGDG